MKSLKRSIQLFSFAFMLAFAGIHFSANDAQACDVITGVEDEDSWRCNESSASECHACTPEVE